MLALNIFFEYFLNIQYSWHLTLFAAIASQAGAIWRMTGLFAVRVRSTLAVDSINETSGWAIGIMTACHEPDFDQIDRLTAAPAIEYLRDYTKLCPSVNQLQLPLAHHIALSKQGPRDRTDDT